MSTPAGAYRLSWLLLLIDQDSAARRQIPALERLRRMWTDERRRTATRSIAA